MVVFQVCHVADWRRSSPADSAGASAGIGFRDKGSAAAIDARGACDGKGPFGSHFIFELFPGNKNRRIGACFYEGNLERAMGIEPTAQAWEAWVLPLYDARLFQKELNPDFPLGGTSCLFACWRCLFGHFGRLLRANRTTIGLSHPTKLLQKSIRHHRKP